MGMNRPSIYAAFGDKRALYRRAVTAAAGWRRRWHTFAVRARTGASAAVLEALIDATVDVICGQPD
jgi:AcrR family transcriptional regulator